VCGKSGGNVTAEREPINQTSIADGVEVTSLHDHIETLEDMVKWLHDHRAVLHFGPTWVSMIALFGTHSYGARADNLLDAIEKAQASADSRV